MLEQTLINYLINFNQNRYKPIMNLAIKLTTLALVGASTNVYAHDLRGSVANTVSDSANSVVSFSRSGNASLILAHLPFSLSY